MIPLLIDCNRRRVVIFGGGEVAARKAGYFSGKADLVIVSRSFVPAFDDLKVTRRELDIDKASGRDLAGILTGAFLVIAATSDVAINNRIGRISRATGILFNNADGEAGDVILPSVSSGENYLLAISTGGNSPAVSRYLREKIEEDFPGLDEMIALQGRLRDLLKEQEPDQKKRKAILDRVLHDPGVWAALAAKRTDVWDDIRARYLP